MSESKKNVVVTGASRGLGLAIARKLCDEGHRVIGVSRSPSPAFSALEETGQAFFFAHDLAEIEGIPDLISRIVSRHGLLYGLVSNAGIGHDGLLATQHNSEIQKVLRVNLEAAIVLSKYACRSMLRNACGRIVFISSITASTGFNGLAAYAASKAGLEGLARSLARELGRAGDITVNCVAPGYMETEMTSGLAGGRLAAVKRRAPLGLAEPEDAASAVVYLLSEHAKKITGTVITVDGGGTA